MHEAIRNIYPVKNLRLDKIKGGVMTFRLFQCFLFDGLVRGEKMFPVVTKKKGCAEVQFPGSSRAWLLFKTIC